MRVLVIKSGIRCSSDPAWGLGQDAALVDQVIRECNSMGHAKVEWVTHIDPTQFFCGPVAPKPAHIAIHLEQPCRAAWPWATKHIVIVNQEWWPTDAWDWVKNDAECLFLFKSHYARSLFPELDGKQCRIIRWRAGNDIARVLNSLGKAPPRREFLYLVGASTNKLEAARSIVAAWNVSLPELKIVGTQAVLDLLQPIGKDKGVSFRLPYDTVEECVKAQATYAYHVVASAAEGFGYTFAEAAAVGALPLWTGIPIYDELWSSLMGNVGRIAVSLGPPTEYRDSNTITMSAVDIVSAVQKLITLDEPDETRLRGLLKHATAGHTKEFRNNWKTLLQVLSHKVKSVAVPSLPPAPPALEDLPHVAIITLTYNRKRWWGNMAQNMLKTNYPPDRLTWIIADDSDGLERVDEDVMKFQSTNPTVNVKYLSIPKKLAIGDKRNRACAAAPSTCTVFAMMDDDDHYPASSVAARVSWLLGLKKDCVYCSTLPMYDIRRYISAINVPPLTLPPYERVSEASLCFTRTFWEARKFPGPVNVAEAEAFLTGRMTETAEIPPYGILVSFIHTGNSSSRRVPKETESNGSHYGFDDSYFSYLCKIGGEAE